MSSSTEKTGNRALKGDFSHIVQKLGLCNSYYSVIKIGMFNVIPTEKEKYRIYTKRNEKYFTFNNKKVNQTKKTIMKEMKNKSKKKVTKWHK